VSRVVLITSDAPRHRAVARVIAARLDLAAVVAEAKPPMVREADWTDPDDLGLARAHFRARDEAEARWCGDDPFPAGVPVARVPRGGAAHAEAADLLRRARPDAVLLFGCGIVGDDVLGLAPGRAVNLHLGLSPWYRGSGTNFHPLADGLPECVGATVHLASAEVDAGPVLVQARPEPDPADGCHDLGTKAALAGAAAMAEAVPRLLDGSLVPTPQPGGVGRVFRRRDFTPRALRAMLRRFAEGMMPAYVADRARRDAAWPIVGGR